MSERTKHLIAMRAHSGPVGDHADNGVTLPLPGQSLLTERRRLTRGFQTTPRRPLHQRNPVNHSTRPVA